MRSVIGPPLLLVGDLAYSAHAILNEHVPGTGDAKMLRKTYALIRELKTKIPDLLIVPSHDDGAIAELNSAFEKEASNG